jgi:undecaprenyl pyrophosphate phosphatase UppP
MTKLAAKSSSRHLVVVCMIIVLVAPAIMVKFAPERVRNDVRDYFMALGGEITTVSGLVTITSVLDYLRKHHLRVVAR